MELNNNDLIDLCQYIKSPIAKEYFINAINTLFNVNGWEWLANFNGNSFLISRDPMLKAINENMNTGDYAISHSAITFVWIMQQMKQLVLQNKEDYELFFKKY